MKKKKVYKQFFAVLLFQKGSCQKPSSFSISKEFLLVSNLFLLITFIGLVGHEVFSDRNQPQRRILVQQQRFQQMMTKIGQNGQMQPSEQMDWGSPGNNRSSFLKKILKRINEFVERAQRRKNKLQNPNLITLEPDLRR